METDNFQKSCRFCLKHSTKMINVFSYCLQPGGISLVSFIRRLTDLKVVKGEFLPGSSCMSCIELINSIFAFIQLCITNDDIIKKEETRRQFRKIEQEALLDENDVNGENLLENEALTVLGGQDTSSVKCEEAVSPETTSNAQVEIVPDFSDAECELRNTKSTFLEPKTNSIKIKLKYVCQFCEMKFSNKSKFLNHQKMHDESKEFKCPTCFQGFSKEAYLRIHLRSHAKTEEKKFRCSRCGKQFMYEYLLKKHEFNHSDKKPFPCTKCEKGCLTSENLKRHMKTHDENYVKKVYCCTVCRKNFSFPSSLAEHMRLHTGEKPHLCSVCGKGFRQSGSLHFHQRIHTGFKPFSCETCSERFKSRSLLKVHMRKHTNERPFVCDSCGVAFRQSSDLKCHMRTHTGEKPVLCTICGKRMSTSGQLTVHLRSHTGEKPYKCEFCQKAFGTKTILQKHTRIHTGERPYVCTICNKAFNQSSTLKTHSNIHRAKPEKIKSTNSKREVRKSRKSIRNEKTTVKIEVNNQERNNSTVQTKFTVILPAPIPLLTTTY